MCSDFEARYGALIARCSDYARHQLEEIRGHDLFWSVMDALEAIPGQLYATDVEKALYEAVKRNNGEEPLR